MISQIIKTTTDVKELKKFAITIFLALGILGAQRGDRVNFMGNWPVVSFGGYRKPGDSKSNI